MLSITENCSSAVPFEEPFFWFQVEPFAQKVLHGTQKSSTWKQKGFSDLWGVLKNSFGTLFSKCIPTTVQSPPLAFSLSLPRHLPPSLYSSHEFIRWTSWRRDHSKGSEYLQDVNKVLQFFVLYKLATILNLFLLCHYGVLCVDWKKDFIHFRIWL
jgi:hypothetical protein